MKIIILLSLLLNSLIILSQNDKAFPTGKWFNYYDEDNYLVLDPDSLKIYNNNFEYSQSWHIKKPGVFLTENGLNEIPVPYYYSLFDDFMVLLTIKPNLNQVDEIALFVKNVNKKQLPKINSKIKVSVNNYLPGLYMILLPNFQRSAKKLIIEEERKITVNKKFIESSVLVTPFDFALKNFEIYSEGKRLPVFFQHEFLQAKNNEMITNEDLIACIYGFNQIGRKTINDKLKKDINGDILMLYIGPAKSFNEFPSSMDF